jgi:hypothetical protein
MSDRIDWSAVRQRVRAAGMFLGVLDDADRLSAHTDDQLNENPAFTNFAAKNGISIDWLVTGEGRPMLDPERVRRHPLSQEDASATA